MANTLATEKKITAVSMLCEGNSIRSIERMHYAYYSFVKTHGTIRCTPAMEAGVEASHWTVAEIVERMGE